jgi:DtxR family Mn-dependent transcriptional regulator|uniref:Metal-dependent transcriptional regulator n=1 Tax=candidate division WOR-3 bacterium TaxID=2052148 RepID=A0A7V3UZH5_UNCW3
MFDKTNIFQQAGLGESQENYLEAILVLGREQKPVRVKDIARFLQVSRPSVVTALAALAVKGLVRHERYGGVELTVAGRAVAEAVYQRHLLLEQFLYKVLGVSRAVARQDACRLEHSLSPETMKRLMIFVQQIDRQ